MPIRKVSGGYQWGQHGTVYPSRRGAEKQAQAAYANGYHENKVDHKAALKNAALSKIRR